MRLVSGLFSRVKFVYSSVRCKSFALQIRILSHRFHAEMRRICIVCIIFVLYCIDLIRMQTDNVFVTNLSPQCMRCLCYAATNCDLTRGCIAGYCGPYKISRVYWIDAGRLVMPEDDAERAGAFEDCALHYECAQRLVVNYMARYGRDCNNDGVTDCTDFSMINFNGGWQCSPDLTRNEAGRNWTIRYNQCLPSVI